MSGDMVGFLDMNHGHVGCIFVIAHFPRDLRILQTCSGQWGSATLFPHCTILFSGECNIKSTAWNSNTLQISTNNSINFYNPKHDRFCVHCRLLNQFFVSDPSVVIIQLFYFHVTLKSIAKFVTYQSRYKSLWSFLFLTHTHFKFIQYCYISHQLLFISSFFNKYCFTLTNTMIIMFDITKSL